jgi:opacity protein-like surface antigen
LKRSLVTLATLGIIAWSQSAMAQPRAAHIASDGIEIVTGIMDYDLSGTGRTIPITIRATKALSDHVSFEAGATIANPDQQFGRSSFTAPEVRAVYSWRLGRVLPFIAGGGGFSATHSDFLGTRWRSTLLAGGGARVQLNDRIYAIGELRLRGITRKFAGSTGEFLGGLGWRF